MHPPPSREPVLADAHSATLIATTKRRLADMILDFGRPTTFGLVMAGLIFLWGDSSAVEAVRVTGIPE
jgi:hypothetical protein